MLLRGGAAAGAPVALVVVATLSAFAGAFLDRRLLASLDLEGLHRLVGALLVVVAIALVAGIA